MFPRRFNTNIDSSSSFQIYDPRSPNPEIISEIEGLNLHEYWKDCLVVQFDHNILLSQWNFARELLESGTSDFFSLHSTIWNRKRREVALNLFGLENLSNSCLILSSDYQNSVVERTLSCIDENGRFEEWSFCRWSKMQEYTIKNLCQSDTLYMEALIEHVPLMDSMFCIDLEFSKPTLYFDNVEWRYDKIIELISTYQHIHFPVVVESHRGDIIIGWSVQSLAKQLRETLGPREDLIAWDASARPLHISRGNLFFSISLTQEGSEWNNLAEALNSFTSQLVPEEFQGRIAQGNTPEEKLRAIWRLYFDPNLNIIQRWKLKKGWNRRI